MIFIKYQISLVVFFLILFKLGVRDISMLECNLINLIKLPHLNFFEFNIDPNKLTNQQANSTIEMIVC